MRARESIWSSFSDMYDYPALSKDITTDVAIIGGGITGISTAKLLADRGVNVTVLESGKVGGGTTSHSTGNLYYTIDKILSSLQLKYDLEVIKDVADSRNLALKQIESWVNKYNLDCDFREVPWYLYSSHEQSVKKIEDELEAGVKAGLPIMEAEQEEVPYSCEKAIRIPRQYQVNPMRYLQELAQTVNRDLCRICEHTHVLSVEEQNEYFRVITSAAEIHAEKVVYATHTPKGIMSVQTLLGPYREYGIACKTEGLNLPDGIFWGYHDKGEKISTRNYRRSGEEFLIVVGESHKVGQAGDNEGYIRKLEKFAESYFNVQNVEYRWGGQHYRPADLLPYIGPKKEDSGEFIATGFSTDGLVYGTLAGLIMSDQITGRDNSWSELYSANRIRPLKSAFKFLKENLDVAGQYLKNIPGLSGKSDVSDLKSGEGRIVDKGGRKLAVYRHEDGRLEIVSAVCSHMSCIVQWNNAELSWDCPCHGSRFRTDGSVIEGPAWQALDNVEVSSDIE